MNAFSTLEKIFNFYLKDKHLAVSLEKEKCYLKTLYPVHCIDKNSNFKTYKPAFALSDTTNEALSSSETRMFEFSENTASY